MPDAIPVRTLLINPDCRDWPKVVFPLTAVTESGTISEQSVSAVTETTQKLIAHLLQ